MIRVALALLACLALGCGRSGAAPGAPRLEVEGGVAAEEMARAAGAAPVDAAAPTAQAVPSVRPGATVHARYAIRNGGGRELLLYGLVSDCACRVAGRLPDALAGGEEATIAILCRAPWAAGEARCAPRLLSNDPARPDETLRIVLHVEGGAEPGALYFGYVPVGGAAIREVVVPRPAAGSGAAARPAASDPAISIEPRPPRADGRSLYRVRFAPRAAGVLRTFVDLGGGAAPVPVSGVGFADVLAFPAEVRLSALPGAAGSALPAIDVKNVGAAPLEVARIEYPAGLSGEVQVLVPGRDLRITLRRRSAPAPGTPRAAPGTPPAAPGTPPAAEGTPAIRILAGASLEPVVTIPVLSVDEDAGAAGPGSEVMP